MPVPWNKGSGYGTCTRLTLAGGTPLLRGAGQEASPTPRAANQINPVETTQLRSLLSIAQNAGSTRPQGDSGTTEAELCLRVTSHERHDKDRH